MSKWKVSSSDVVKRKLKKYKSSEVLNRYLRFVGEVEGVDDPEQMGEQKRGRYRYWFGHRLTKSVRVIYKPI